MTLLTRLRDDRLLLAGTVTLALTTLAPLFASPFPPLADLPVQAGAAALLDEVLGGDLPAAGAYAVRVAAPSWLLTLALFLAGAVLGPALGAKFVLALALLALPLAAMRLLLALGRDPRAGLLVFALAWDASLLNGPLSFRLGIALALLLLAWLLDARPTRARLRTSALGLALALTDAHALAFAGLALLVVAAVGHADLRRRLALVGAVTLGVGAALWWLTLGGSDGLSPDWTPLPIRARRWLPLTVGVFGADARQSLAAVALVVLLLTPLALGVRRAPGAPTTASGRMSAALLVLAVVLFLALPGRLGDDDHLFHRYAPLLLLFAFAVPAADLRGARFGRLAPALVATLGLHVATFFAVDAFGERARPFTRVVDALPRGAAMLTLAWQRNDPAVRAPALAPFHAWATATRGGYDPLLADVARSPLRAKPGGRRRHPPAHGPRFFQRKRHPAAYDHVLIQGLRKDPLTADGSTELVVEAGRWRLYRVKPEARKPP